MGSIKPNWIRSSKDIPIEDKKLEKSAHVTIKYEDSLIKYSIEAETLDGIMEEMRRIINDYVSE